jgi:hypothetical protein
VVVTVAVAVVAPVVLVTGTICRLISDWCTSDPLVPDTRKM